MKFNHCLLAVFLATGAACAATGTDQHRDALEDAVITERSTVPPYAGYIRTWIQFEVALNGTKHIVLLPNFEDGKRIPETGDTCHIQYHSEVIEGQVGDKYIRAATANVVDRMECEGG
jgi:hypothetical protein